MKPAYVESQKRPFYPRIPLEGAIDITYRCNNNCRHCWLREDDPAANEDKEISFEQIKRVATEAAKLGCRSWSISGGEPMLRADFSEIFDLLTGNSAGYSLNTNGTLITPAIARLMKRKGSKMVALYGATADVHDKITRRPGSFEELMRGFAYLKEAGAGFTVQLIPMRDNYHQFKEMVALAESLSKHYRIGAAWLYSCVSLDPQRRQEIFSQRLPPKTVVDLDQPDISFAEALAEDMGPVCAQQDAGRYFYSMCISTRNNFHIDAYAGLSFCCFIKDPQLRYDLKKGNFPDAWENFIPSLRSKIPVNQEYKDNCGSCAMREDCRWCPVYGYLEHGRHSAKVDYLCKVSAEARKFKEDWLKDHRRYYQVGGITLQVDSDLPVKEDTFLPKFRHFQVEKPGDDIITIRHHFFIPEVDRNALGEEVYHRVPWAIFRKNGSWTYLGISPEEYDPRIHSVLIFNHDHTRVTVYNDKTAEFLKGQLHSLAFLPTDQIILAQVLADRQGCILHSCGVIMDGKGILFAGHSEAGKSTMATMLKGHGEILCDDRNVIRRHGRDFRVYGTWSHGDIPDVSGATAPLNAICFLEKAQVNELIPMKDKKEIARRMMGLLIRPLATAEWWDKSLNVADEITANVPCYVLRFDKSGKVVSLLKKHITGV
jgi:MoaA/NifB/PqqE/SkfB family radical SAM enzyme